MGRFWNLRTKLVGVLVLVLSGTFLLQSVIHDHNEKHLLAELERVVLDITNEAVELVRSELAGPGTETQVYRFYLSARSPDPARSARSSARRPVGRERGTLFSREVRLVLESRDVGETTMVAGVEQEDRLEDALLDLRGDLQRVFTLIRDPSSVFPGDSFLESVESFEPASDAEAPLDVLAGSPAGASLLESIPPSSDSAVLEPSTIDTNRLTPWRADRAGRDPAAPVTAINVTPYFDRIRGLTDASKRHDRLATFGVFLIGIALAWFLGVRVTRPVDEVVHGFQRLAEGDFETRVDERPGEEFEHLGRQFNAMVDRLREGRELERDLSQRERIRHMGDLAAGVAHDVRNPLNAIHLNIGQIRDEFVPEGERSRERFLRFTADVQREVERLNQLVTNFLSLAQPAAESAESVMPNDLVDELYRLLKKEATGQGIELELALADDLPPVQWNRQELKSAFLNIAINAIQAMREGGGRLEIATALRDGHDGRELLVRFTDDGPGIPAGDLERVFVPYYTTREGGTGLGMAIARRTAERHGGRLELSSTVGEGTAVAFVFPVPVDRPDEGGIA